MKLTKHFTLEELCVSQEATRRGIPNLPSPRSIENLKQLCISVLEPLRDCFGAFTPTSCYRSPELNRAIGGSLLSQHMEGKAADLILNNVKLSKLFNWIVDNIDFDQVIREFPPGGWVHVSYDEDRQRGSKLVALRDDGRTVYKGVDAPITA